jgi:sirohydrochlorin cobaltochelatase
MSGPAGLVLLAHGARDPRWSEPLERLRDRVAEREPSVRVELAFLEHLEPGLDEAIGRLADCASVTVVPVFLGQGGHVRRDVPDRVERARAAFPAIEIRVAGSIGDDAAVIDAMAAYCVSTLR